MSKIKRSLIKTFLNTGSVGSPVWTLISPGVTAAKIGMEPKTTEEQYVNESSASFSVDSYAPKMPIESLAINGDVVFEFLDSMRKSRDILDDAESEVLQVYLYKGVAGTLYLAYKHAVSIPIEKFGGPAGKAANLAYSLNYKGAPVVGLFDASDSTFEESVSLAYLTSLVIDSDLLVLTPAFKGKRIWYKTATDDATNDITVAGPAGASFVIDVDGVPVDNGDPATWTEGLNVVTIASTVGSDVATYIVLVTYTPAV